MSVSGDPLSQQPVDSNPSSSDATENDETVLTTSTQLKAEKFPTGLTPRELAFALSGELLNHFHLQKFIGGGGMGVVFKALDTTLDRIVAVKVLATNSLSEEYLQRRFLVEAQSTARLDHPNIARVHYVGRDRGLPYIVFEFIDGANVRDLVVNHGAIPLGDALNFAYQIAHALAHAWQREVVHRDIKPSNILITRDGQAKLVDMGLARLYQSKASDTELTSTGMTLGTFDYISPEQARDARAADIRSDIYSLGCTLFYMLAGRPPFANGTAVEKLLQHQGDRPPTVRSLGIDVPDTVDSLLQTMLEKQPADRPQSPPELVGAIGSVLESLGLPLPQSLAPLPYSAPSRNFSKSQRHLVWALPSVILVIITSFLYAGRDGKAIPNDFPSLRVYQPPSASASSTPPIEQPNFDPENVPNQMIDLPTTERIESPGPPGRSDSIDFDSIFGGSVSEISENENDVISEEYGNNSLEWYTNDWFHLEDSGTPQMDDRNQ